VNASANALSAATGSTVGGRRTLTLRLVEGRSTFPAVRVFKQKYRQEGSAAGKVVALRVSMCVYVCVLSS
jgi:hypothetical protein